jgi:transglutaminase-like putative cysteine protease
MDASAPHTSAPLWQRFGTPAWHRLPREARDTLFLLATIGWVVAPHLLHLPWWCTAMALALLAWRARLAALAAPLPPRWLVMALLAVATGLTAWTQGTLLGKDAGVTLLVVLMSLKTLELRARRDAMVVFFLGFFLVLTQLLFSQALLVALWILASVWALLTALVLAHMPVGRPPLALAARYAARSALLGVPLMALLFVLFPRIGPLWGLPDDALGRTGLSGSMRLGAVAELANDDTVALRLRFFGPAPRPDQLYFRGPVLATFDGREWTRVVPSFGAAQRPRAEPRIFGRGLRYEITVEPNRLPILPLLELTPDLPGMAPQIEGYGAAMRPDAQWQLDRNLTDRIRTEVTAFLDHQHGPQRPVLGLRDYVDLPPGFNPRTLAWAAGLRQRPELRNADPRTLMQATIAHIAKGGFTYTMAPGTYGRDAVDEFWLDRKAGFCEHFSAAFVVVMRALDVPARIVTGYQGADPDPVDGYVIVRNLHAHAWAEIWQPGEGWVRVDPTAAVDPARIAASRNLAPNPGAVTSAMRAISPELAARMRQAWEALNNRWNQWVLNYSRERQFSLLEWLGWQTPSAADMARVLVVVLAALALAGALWAAWDRRRQDPWQRLQRRVRKRLGELGVEVAAHDPPRRRAAVVRGVLGARGEPLAEALEALDAARYGSADGRGTVPRGWWREFRRLAPAS